MKGKVNKEYVSNGGYISKYKFVEIDYTFSLNPGKLP